MAVFIPRSSIQQQTEHERDRAQEEEGDGQAGQGCLSQGRSDESAIR